jgi:hypothetical protein
MVRKDQTSDAQLRIGGEAEKPPWQIKSGHSAAANQHDGQITSDFQKWCQAPKLKIFCFAPDPNHF